MVAVRRFVPDDRPRVAVSSDGTLAAIHERTRVAVVEVPTCAPFSELGMDPNAADTEVVWVGSPPRLLVLSRHASHTTAHLVDPFGPRTIAEHRFESAMKLCATAGANALVVGPQEGAVVLVASASGLDSSPFPARALPLAAGAAGGLFVVALAGVLEEWDPQSRLPKRRLKLKGSPTVTAVGGSDRMVWMTTREAPARMDVFALADRGQHTAHELPEPIAHVASHPHSDLVACIGGRTGRIWVLDLDGRTGLRMVGPEGIDRAEAVGLVVGPVVGVLAAQTRRPITMVALRSSTGSVPIVPAAQTAADPRAESQPGVEEVLTSVTLGSPADAPSPPREDTQPEPSGDWREEVAAWARHVITTGIVNDPPSSPPIEALVADHQLTQYAAIILLYGAHLEGFDGAAPIDVARVAGWPEALARGELAERGVAVYASSRVRLEPSILRALDDLAP